MRARAEVEWTPRKVACGIGAAPAKIVCEDKKICIWGVFLPGEFALLLILVRGKVVISMCLISQID